MYEALRDYLKDSELRIADKNLHIRMSPELAKKYDAGAYDFVVAEQLDCIRELMALNLLPDKSKKFYIYLVPDDRLVELLMYPYKDAESGGRPVRCFDDDGLSYAHGSSQNLFLRQEKRKTNGHVNDLHEYSHLIQGEYATKDLFFNEGFAELLPWYVLNYERKTLPHIMTVLDTDIYSASNMLGRKDVYRDVVAGRTISFQKSYISAYIFMRTIIEKIEEKYNLDKVGAAKFWLQWIAETKLNCGLLVTEFANKLGLNAEKLLYTTDYQKEVLQKMSNLVKMNQNIIKPMDDVKR